MSIYSDKYCIPKHVRETVECLGGKGIVLGFTIFRNIVWKSNDGKFGKFDVINGDFLRTYENEEEALKAAIYR